jgi:putative ABC transport system permease protein
MRWFIPLAWWDKLSRTTSLAIRSLWLHKLRAFLSVLGIIIGTAAVISLMAFGEGSMQDALDDIKRQGATNIIIKSVKPADSTAASARAWSINYGLTKQDFDILPYIIKTIVRSVPMRIYQLEVRYLDRAVKGRVVGTTRQYAEVNDFEIAAGRFLVDEDEWTTDNVAVLGAGLADFLFPFEDPIGNIVLVNNKMPYKIVGVISERLPTGSGSGKTPEEFNMDIYIPLRTNEGRIGDKVMIRTAGARSGEQVQLHQITLTVDDMSHVRDCGQLVKDLLKSRHMKNDWEVTIPLDRLEEAERQRDRFTMLLAWIGGISLFVGGIGIMNIMLATVTERTREIGVRRALGAKRRDITIQFLIEAVVQTTMGGLIGLVLGLIVVFGAPMVNLGPAKLNVMWTILAIIASVLVGVLFGWYPAWRASKLDPIEALRHV